MRTKNRYIGLLVACSVVFCALEFRTYTAAIDSNGGSGSTTVNLTVAAATLSVTVPTSLPVYVAADGTVTCAGSGTARITNLGRGPVKVSSVDIKGQNGWSVVDYSENLSGLPVGTKQIAFKLNNVTDVTDNSAGLAAAIGSNGSIAANAHAEITYAANIQIQGVAIDGESVATIVFTIGWDVAE